MNETYVICRPRGGLNDTLCQIEKCWRYAEMTGRTLLVDGSCSDFCRRISDIFVPRIEVRSVRFDPDPTLLDQLDPDVRTGQARTAHRRTFDFRRRYRAPVLVHSKVGGGLESVHLLGRVVLEPAIQSVVRDRLAMLDEGYLAVHVRNTDLRTDAERLFHRIAPHVCGRTLLVCSDDARVIDHARRFFASSRVVTVSTIPDLAGAPLHHGAAVQDEVTRHRHAVDAIVDLLALGGADAMFYATDSVYTKRGGDRAKVSGFSRLAAHLACNKYLIDELLQRDTRYSASLRRRSTALYRRIQTGMLGLALRCQRHAG